jgi:hypothetical protein
MAVAHINFNSGTQHGALLRSGLQRLEDAFHDLNELKSTMALMIDGDGSQAAHFPYMTQKFSFDNDAGAKAAWEELNSLLFKLNTDASVSSVNAALLQAFNKFR